MSQIKKLQLGGTTLHYGTDKVVDAEEFNNKIASKVEDYIASLNWSKKEKLRFRDAYQDIMSRGVTGMEVVNGVRNTTYNGEQIDNKALAKKLRESYGNAAYFINELLEASAYNPEERAKQEEEKAEAEEKARIAALPKFSPNDFDKFFIKTVFGGQENPNINDWDELDTVDPETKLRGIENRKLELSKLIDAYIQQLPELNYEGSSFKNLQEYKEKLEKAKNSLQLGDFKEIKLALNAAGINWRHFLETDTLTPEGRLAFEQQKEQAAQEAAKQVEQLAKQEVKEDKEAEKESGISFEEQEISEKETTQHTQSFKELIDKDPQFFYGQVTGLAADLASIIDPEPFSAAALGLVGSAAREISGDKERGFWTRVADWGTGVLGAVPLLGDAFMASKFVKGLGTLMKWGGAAFTAYIAAEGGPELAKKIGKAVSEGSISELSMDDLQALSGILIGMKSFKSGENVKAKEAVAAARGLRKKGILRFKLKDGTNVKVDLDDTYNAEIFKNLNKKSPDEIKRILGDNQQVTDKLHKLNKGIDDIEIGEGKLRNKSFLRRATGKRSITLKPGESYFTRGPLSKKRAQAVARLLTRKEAENAMFPWAVRARDWLGNVTGYRGRRIYAVAKQDGNVIRRRFGNKPVRPAPDTLNTPPTPPPTPTPRPRPHIDLRQRLTNSGGIIELPRIKKSKPHSLLLIDNGNGTWTLSNTAASPKGRSGDIIISNSAEMDYLNNILNGSSYHRRMNLQRYMESKGIFRQGGKIYNNLDAYLTDFIKRNK